MVLGLVVDCRASVATEVGPVVDPALRAQKVGEPG